MNRKDFFKRVVAGVTGFSLLPTTETKSNMIDDINNNSRHQRYIKYEAMDFQPDVSTLLDHLAINVASRFKFHSSNPIIQSRIGDLFTNLNMRVNNELWIRNTAKYGNNFLYVSASNGSGIMSARQLVNHNVMIKDSFGNSEPTKDVGAILYHVDSSQKYRRFSSDDGKHTIEFNNIEVIDFTAPYLHENMLPYGTSMLEKYHTNSFGGLYFTEKEVTRFEQSISHAFTKLVLIHLYYSGYHENDELTNFTISFE